MRSGLLRKLSVDDLEDENGKIDCILIPVAVGLLPFFRSFFEEMKSEGAWASQEDWERGRKYWGWQEAQLFCDIKTQLENMAGLTRDLVVMQAKSLGLDYEEALEAPMPALAAALYDAEQVDSAEAMDAIYRHAVGTVRQTEIRDNNDQIACALIGALISVATSGQVPASIAAGACSVLRAGGSAALELLGDLIEYGIGNNATLGLRGSGDDPPTSLLSVVDELEEMLGYEDTT